MKNLIEILKKETESLKKQYLAMTEKWAVSSYEEMKKKDFLYLHTSGKYFQKRFGSTKSEDAMFARTANIINGGVENYKVKMLKAAEKHYENSILKLAFRIEDKGMNVDNLKIETAHVGVNFEATLTDGNKTVRAFTIIAEGIVQRPHYRYLIK